MFATDGFLKEMYQKLIDIRNPSEDFLADYWMIIEDYVDDEENYQCQEYPESRYNPREILEKYIKQDIYSAEGCQFAIKNILAYLKDRDRYQFVTKCRKK